MGVAIKLFCNLRVWHPKFLQSAMGGRPWGEVHGQGRQFLGRVGAISPKRYNRVIHRAIAFLCRAVMIAKIRALYKKPSAHSRNRMIISAT